MLGKEKEKVNATTYDIYIVGEQIRHVPLDVDHVVAGDWCIVYDESSRGPKQRDCYLVKLQMHKATLIKDRRYRLRKYKKCFVGRDAVDWLVKMCHAQSRGEAVMSMRCLQEHGMLHHVVDDHVFQDRTLFFRFAREDDRYLLRSDLTAFYRGLEVFNSIKDEGIRREFYHRGHLYQGAFYGNDLVDCLIAVRGDDRTLRTDVVNQCRELLEFDIIRHVTDDYHFTDDRLMYQFHVDYERSCLLSDVLNPTSSTTYMYPIPDARTAEFEASSSVDRPMPVAGSEGSSVDTTSSVLGGHSFTDSDYLSRQDSTITSGTDDDMGEYGDSMSHLSLSRGDSERAKVTMVKRVVKLQKDEVGYGFVLRGSDPCYVHTIDPLGPASAAGLKEGQYVLSVDGHNVKQHDHRHVGRLVMTHTGGLLTLVVMTKTTNHNDY